MEDLWRLLREARDERLRSSDSRSVLLQPAGALSDDEMISEVSRNLRHLAPIPGCVVVNRID